MDLANRDLAIIDVTNGDSDGPGSFNDWLSAVGNTTKRSCNGYSNAEGTLLQRRTYVIGQPVS